MKATGIVRRIDDLGRVVIPKEIRRTMRIREGDPLLTSLTQKDKAIQYVNIALESNPRKIAEKIKKDEAFIIIMHKLTIPLNLENIEEKPSGLSGKDRKAKEHLEKSSEITRSIGYDEIKMLKYKKSKLENVTEKEQEKQIENEEEKQKEIENL